MTVLYLTKESKDLPTRMALLEDGCIHCPKCKCQRFQVCLDTKHYMDLICNDCAIVIHILTGMQEVTDD